MDATTSRPAEHAAGPPGGGPQRKDGGLASVSPVDLFDSRRVAFFHWAFARFFRRHMRALRLSRRGGVPEAAARADAPLVVFANHPSWWDGVAFMLLSQRLFPGRPMFTPMEAAALSRYGFMRRIGVFGIETGTPRGASAFLRIAREVLAHPSRMLWLNAPGRFSDARERPVPVAPGVTRLPEIAPHAIFVPLALDYVFWTERRAEMLAAFGPPLTGAELLATERGARAERFSAALAATMDRLAEDAISRDPDRFQALLRGQEGMGGAWPLVQRMQALMRGERYDPRHDPRAEA